MLVLHSARAGDFVVDWEENISDNPIPKNHDTIQVDYIRAQIYFLKKMLLIRNASEDEKIRAFDAAVKEIDEVYNRAEYKGISAVLPVSSIGEDHNTILEYLNSITQFPHSRVHEELLYNPNFQDFGAVAKKFTQVLVSKNKDDVVVDQPNIHTRRFGTEISFLRIKFDPANENDLKLVNSLFGKYRQFDFEVPMEMAFPKQAQMYVRHLGSKLPVQESVIRYNEIRSLIDKKKNELDEERWKLQKDFETRYWLEHPEVVGDEQYHPKYHVPFNRTLSIWKIPVEKEFKARLNGYAASLTVEKFMGKKQSHFFSDLLGYRPLALSQSLEDNARSNLIELSTSGKLKILNGIFAKFAEFDNKLDHVAEELIKSREISFDKQADQRFFELLLSTYYTDISNEVKNDILKAIIENPDLGSGIEMFKLLVLHSGPQMQKLLQVLGRNEGFSPKLREIFSQVEESGLKTPWETAEHKFIRPPIGFEWISLERNPMVGSMAQTYRGLVRDAQGNGLKIAARILKDGIKDKLNAEKTKLEKMAYVIDSDPVLQKADFPLIGPILGDVQAMTADETNFQLTLKNQLEAKTKYDSTFITKEGIKIDLVTPVTLASPNPDVLYSTWLEGDKFDHFQKLHEVEARIVAEAIAQKWIETALFSGVFFHADLHQGNMKVRKLSDKHIEIGFLDFGMADRLDETERSALMKLGIELSGFKSSKSLGEYIWSLSEEKDNLISKASLIDQINQRKILTKSGNTADWLKWSSSKGIKLRKNISSFSRGLGAIEQLLLAGKSTESTESLTRIVAGRYKWDLTKLIFQSVTDKIPLNKRFSMLKKPVGIIQCERLFNK